MHKWNKMSAPHLIYKFTKFSQQQTQDSSRADSSRSQRCHVCSSKSNEFTALHPILRRIKFFFQLSLLSRQMVGQLPHRISRWHQSSYIPLCTPPPSQLGFLSLALQDSSQVASVLQSASGHKVKEQDTFCRANKSIKNILLTKGCIP